MRNASTPLVAGLLVFCSLPANAQSSADVEMNCGKFPDPPTNLKSEIENHNAKLDLKAQVLSRMAAEGKLDFGINEEKQKIYQDSDKISRQYDYQYTMQAACRYLFSEKSISYLEKAKAIVLFHKEINNSDNDDTSKTSSIEFPSYILGEWTGQYFCSDQFGIGSLTWNIETNDGKLEVAEKARRMGASVPTHYEATWDKKKNMLHLITSERGGYEIVAFISSDKNHFNGKYINHPSCQNLKVGKL